MTERRLPAPSSEASLGLRHALAFSIYPYAADAMRIGMYSAALAGAVLAATWLVYPLALAAVAFIRRERRRQPASRNQLVRPRASVVVATRDPPAVIRARVHNLLEDAASSESIEIVIAVDTTSSITIDEYRRALPTAVMVVAGDRPGGKACALNAGVRACGQEYVVFADSSQKFRVGAIDGLLHAFSDPTVGAASGTLVPENNRRSVVLGLYWRYESWLRQSESTYDSLVGVTGAIYAIRRGIWIPLPPGSLLDDVQVAFNVVEQGYRVVQVDGAVAVDARAFSAEEEFRRRVRTQTGLLQICMLNARAVLPFGSRIWLQFLLHKICRTVTPFLLAIAGLGLVATWVSMVTALAFGVALLALWLAAGVAPRTSIVGRVRSQIQWTVLLLGAPVIAFYYAFTGNWDVWARHDRKS